ncbi:hypothetical protein C0989_002320 [Termitomyces sp. Mn162]|nr:hypothetical protein C0989_002320 [Termitomyces sp. Mn162]
MIVAASKAAGMDGDIGGSAAGRGAVLYRGPLGVSRGGKEAGGVACQQGGLWAEGDSLLGPGAPDSTGWSVAGTCINP